MGDSGKVAFIGYSTMGSGANRAFGRIANILKASRQSDSTEIIVRVASGGSGLVVTSKFLFPIAVALDSIRNPRLFFRRIKKTGFRLLGGKPLHSRAATSTGLVREVLAAKPNVVVANWFGDYTDSIEELGKVGVPLVLRNGDMWWFQGSRHFVDPPGIPTSRWQGFLEWLFFGREDTDTLERKKKHLYPVVFATVSPSPWMTQQVLDSGLMPHATHVTIPNPLDTKEWFPEDKHQAREQLGISPEEFSIGFGAVGGTRDPRKGADLLMAALKILRAKNNTNRNVRCHVFGEKGRTTSKAGFPVIKHGRLGDESLRQFYSAIDVFVVPSRMEGFPNTALEALACGTPVIAFDTGPMGDYLVHGETALLAEAFSASDLANQIQTALDNPDWISQAGPKGISWVEENLAPTVIARQWFELFASVLEQKRS